jgi:hypothetical protein
MEKPNDFQLIEAYINTKPLLSFSGISKFIFSPYLFYKHYVLNQKEDITGDFLIKGKLLHCLSLEPQNFEKLFIILPNKLPSDVHQGLLKSLYLKHKDESDFKDKDLEVFQEELGEMMLEQEYYAAIKTNLDRGKKIILDANKEYWDYLKKADSKIPVSLADYNETLEKVQILKADRIINYLLKFDLSEKELSILPTDTSFFGLKGIIDSIKFQGNKIFVCDIKTTSKRIQDFPETVEYYNLWLQASIYKELISYHYPEYQVVFTFIVVDQYGVVYPFVVSEQTMQKWNERKQQIMEELNYCFSEKSFMLPSNYKKYEVIL